MKRSIEWHIGCLNNYMSSLEQERKKLETQQKKVDEMEAEVAHRKNTIARAKKEGLTEYDPDKYNKKKEKR